MWVTVPIGDGGVVHPFVVYGYQGSEEDPEKLSLTGKLLSVQPMLIVWDLFPLVGSWILP